MVESEFGVQKRKDHDHPKHECTFCLLSGAVLNYTSGIIAVVTVALLVIADFKWPEMSKGWNYFIKEVIAWLLKDGVWIWCVKSLSRLSAGTYTIMFEFRLISQMGKF